MALIKCPSCGKNISDKAPYCPHCGLILSKQDAPGKSNPPDAPTMPSEIPENMEYTDPSIYDDNPEPRKDRRLILIVVIFLVLLAGGTTSYYFYAKKKAQTAAFAEKARLDSIAAEAAALEAARLDSIRQDSIKYEEEHRFLPTVFIHEELTRDERSPLFYKRPLKSNWEQILISQGFVKGETKTLYVDERGYDEELYDIGAVLYTRNINGRCITVKACFILYKQDQDGSMIPINQRGWHFIENRHEGQSFEIDFSDLQDLDTFWDALKSLGLSKYQSGIGGDYELIDQRKKNGEYVCPSTSFYRDRNTITIFANVDC